MISPVNRVRLFELGKVVVTRGVACRMKEEDGFTEFVRRSLLRHAHGDWGDLCPEDQEENESSLSNGFRVLSAYENPLFPKIWIITEADRSVTTVLLPEEY